MREIASLKNSDFLVKNKNYFVNILSLLRSKKMNSQ